MRKYTLEDFLNIKHEPENLREMTVTFLENEGNNKKLSEIIRKRENIKIELKKIKLSKLRREMGPEEEKLTFSESKESWDKRINSFVEDIKNGYEPLPLIITNFWSELDLSDGSHRHAALEKLGVSEYWSICIFEDK